MYNNSNTNFENDLFRFEINPLELIDEIVFDPRMKIDDYNSKKREVQELGFNKKIIQSGLYKIKKF